MTTTNLAFYTGTHLPNWLWTPAADFPLFVSHRRLARYKTLRPSTGLWALDSGGFTELSMFGGWQTSPEDYVAAVARYDEEIGHLDWAAPQDWMCEPAIIHGGGRFAGTGLTVAEHQARTVANFLQLGELWPQVSDEDNPFMPVLQGWTLTDYEHCADLYEQAGIRLEEFPVVGLGSVCRRESTAEIGAIVATFTPWLAVHGFGVKTGGLTAYGHRLTSADSLAWSLLARQRPPLPGHDGHANCANCLDYAAAWRAGVLDACASGRDVQGDLFTSARPCPCCTDPGCQGGH